MKVTGQSNIGLVRRDNQDAFVTGTLSDTVSFAVVCDGMGGANGGSVASELAIRRVADRLCQLNPDTLTAESVGYVLESAIAAANIDIYDKAQECPELTGMGTTIVAAVGLEHSVCIAHVGDSRAYLLTKDRMTQITKDHSVVQRMLENGEITEDEAKHHPRKNFITRALGVEDSVQSDYVELEWQAGDRVMLCTDGLTNMLEEQQLERLAREQAADEKLMEAALSAGGSDNITVCFMEY